MPEKKKIVLVGGGGHCNSCIDVIEEENKFEIAGIIDVKEKIGESVLKYKIIGSDEDLPKIISKYQYFLITVGFIKISDLRQELYQKIKQLGGHFPNITSPRAYISKYSKIGEGNIIMHDVLINANVEIGNNNIINSKALIEHDVKIGHHNHLSTAAVINGGVKIGNKNLLGSNSTILHSIMINKNSIIGAGAVVVDDVLEEGIYIGCPAKKRK